MTYMKTWEEFAKAAEKLYSQDPWKVRFVVKYRHCDGTLVLKMTDDKQYRTDQHQDVKKLEKLNGVLMRHMISKIA
ncbi:hypothetical protein EMCRGX_G032230 [Ephydatia muelleri]